MTLVAVHAVVHIAADALVIGIRLRLRMAIRALEDAVIVRVRMAGGTHAACVAMIGGEPCVIKCRSRPCGCAMARLAGSGKACSDVVRIGRALIIGFVARIAIGRDRSVVVVHVAIGAGHCLSLIHI